MNFQTVTRKLVAAFSEQSIDYALIGGYAVGLWGVPRGTVDMDFLVRREDMGKVHAIMVSLAYETAFSSENVTQYVSPIVIFGEIDFVHAFREASLAMLKRSVEKTLFGDGVSIKVLIPEDLIGLKLQALSNNVDRGGLDMYDIEKLMQIHGKTLDWELTAQYFDMFDATALFHELKEKFDADK